MTDASVLSVTMHAEQRWNERFGGGDIMDAIADSFPFGAQRGESQYLLNGDLQAVFVVTKGFVTTVLTKVQAIANMQSKGVRFDEIKSYPAAISEPAKKRRRSTPSSVDKAVHEFFTCIVKSSDDVLAEMALGHRHRNMIDYVLRLRRLEAKRMEHADRENRKVQELLRIIEAEIGPQRRQEVIDLFKEKGW